MINEVFSFGNDKWRKYITESYEIKNVSTFTVICCRHLVLQVINMDNYIGKLKF
jgi:hypothetical protein